MSFAPPDPSHGPVADTPPTPELDVSSVRANVPKVEKGRLDDRSPQVGDLSGSWRVMVGLGWIAAFFAYAAVWNASVQIGIGTWWVGPRAQPTHVVVKIIPFLLAIAITLLVIYNVKHLVVWNAAGVAGAALISIPDFSRSLGLGVAEATIAGLLALIAIASLSGRYRAAADPASP